ncbi:MAG: 16S rRNA (guanine(966)-N(2))-methyltransferase RsmD [Nitrospirae bacterium]|nr:16S rRNA (guanine(966)-N(2))-methyltransferase RsmD [Candidatus Manganitrophaceae bacterium]
MRIVSGALKGRKLYAPPGLDVRPTSNKVKQALFNILSDRIQEASFLDLYAGIGSVGIEALSRGAGEVTFIEKSKRHIQYLKKNLSIASFDDHFRILCMEAVQFLRKKEAARPFDFVFVDPPYEGEEIEKTLPLLGEGDMIADNGWVIVQHFHKKVFSEAFGRLHFLKKYKYGETILSFYGKS